MIVYMTKSGKSVTHEELKAFFSKVENRNNWKLPIDSVVELRDEEDVEILREAVIFFTGSVPKISTLDVNPVNNDIAVRVTAAGYYVATGA